MFYFRYESNLKNFHTPKVVSIQSLSDSIRSWVGGRQTSLIGKSKWKKIPLFYYSSRRMCGSVNELVFYPIFYDVNAIGIFDKILWNESKSCEKVKYFQQRLAHINVHPNASFNERSNKPNQTKWRSRLMVKMAFGAVKQPTRQISHSWDACVYWTCHKFQIWLWDHTTLLFLLSVCILAAASFFIN